MIEEIVIYNQIGQIKNKIVVNNSDHDVTLTDFERGLRLHRACVNLCLFSSRIDPVSQTLARSYEEHGSLIGTLDIAALAQST